MPEQPTDSTGTQVRHMAVIALHRIDGGTPFYFDTGLRETDFADAWEEREDLAIDFPESTILVVAACDIRELWTALDRRTPLTLDCFVRQDDKIACAEHIVEHNPL